MLARIRKSIEEKDQGFTLIELLVVMIIIGILAAIAIPVFLNQRKKAVDSSIKSDLRTVAQQEETYYTDNQKYATVAQTTTTAPTVTIGGTDVKVSTGNVFRVVTLSDASTKATSDDVATGFCIQSTNAKGSTTTGFIYNSLDGGLKAATAASGAGGCPAN